MKLPKFSIKFLQWCCGYGSQANYSPTLTNGPNLISNKTKQTIAFYNAITNDFGDQSMHFLPKMHWSNRSQGSEEPKDCFLFSNLTFSPPPAPTQSPSYAEQGPSSVNLPLSMDPVLAVVTNSTGQQARRHLGDDFSQKIRMKPNSFVATVDSRWFLQPSLPKA